MNETHITEALDELERVAAITEDRGGWRAKVEISVSWAKELVRLGREALKAPTSDQVATETKRQLKLGVLSSMHSLAMSSRLEACETVLRTLLAEFTRVSEANKKEFLETPAGNPNNCWDAPSRHLQTFGWAIDTINAALAETKTDGVK